MTNSAFAEQLQRLRKAAGISQYALAQRSGLSKQALSRLEKGEREPSWATVQRLATALGVDCTAFSDHGLTLPAAGPPPRRGRPLKAAPGQKLKKPRGRKKGE
jgi:transcriptional regulator with XRE-family HTH domain